MKKILPLLVVLLLMITSITYAYQVPEREGMVTDPIGLFTRSEIQHLENALSSKDYEVYVLTASGLQEADGEALAWEAYESWGLSGNQLMLVITVDPNYVHLVFDNLTLKNQIARSKAMDVTGVIEQSFVPLASDGRVVDGVIALSEMIHTIAAQPNPSSTPSYPTSPSQAPNPITRSNQNSTSILFSVVGIVVIFALVLIYLMFRRSTLQRRLQDYRAIADGSLQQINKVIVSELFKELEQGFIQGETKEKLESIEKHILPLRQQLQTLQQQINEQKLSIFTLRKAASFIDSLEHTISQLQKESQTYVEEVHNIEQAAIEVRRLVQQAKERALAIGKEVEQWAQDTTFPLQTLKKQLHEAIEVTTSADHHDEFDILQAKRDVEVALKRLDEVENNLKLLIELKKRVEEIPERISKTEREQRLIVENEQLRLVDANPFEWMDKASKMLPHIHALLQDGNSQELHRTVNTTEEYIDKAVSVVQQMIEHRNFSLQTLQSIEQTQSRLSNIDMVYEQELSKLLQRYAQRHIDEQQQRLMQLKKGLEELSERYAQIRKDCDIAVQKYADAYENSIKAQEWIHQVNQLEEQITTYVSILDTKRMQAIEELSSLRNRFLKSTTNLEQLHLQHNPFTSHISVLEQRIGQLDRLLNTTPHDVEYIEDELRIVRSEVHDFQQAVEQLVREKEKSERQLLEFQETYKRSRLRYGSYVRLSHYNSTYDQMIRNIQQLILMGMFADAMRELSSGYKIIEQMEQEYKREQRRRNSGGGFGGGFGGGSSSWGGGRSSGSSGWRSGSGRSSGSSGWGRGSGRSSGSSKW